jgi:ATP/maltotriose-dependent transcriptional regulator MalT
MAVTRSPPRCDHGLMVLGRAPMIGRDHLLVALRDALAEALAGRPAVVLVEGEAGVGKTRLVGEFLDALPDVAEGGELLLLRGTCSTADRSEVPWGPFLDVLRDLRRSLGDEAFLELAGHRAGELSLLDEGIPVEVPAGGPDRGRLMRVLSGLLLDAVASRPTLLVIEDVQWADEGSCRVLEYVVRSLRKEPVTVVLTVRIDESGPDGVPDIVGELVRAGSTSRLELSGLDRNLTAQLWGQLTDAVPDPQVLDQVMKLSEGIPLLVEEVALALQSDRDLSWMSGRLHGHRLAGLSPDSLTVVEAAAVAVTAPRAVALLDASGLPGEAFDAAMSDVVDAGVLDRRGPLIEFRHAVLREATLERMLPHRERRLHLRWAEVLEQEADGLESAVTVAHHRLAAGETSAALVACARAADVAGRASGFSVQREMLRQVARLWPQVEGPAELVGRDLVDVLGQAAEAAFFTSDFAGTRRQVREAERLLGSNSPPARQAWLDLLVLRSRYNQAEQIPVKDLLSVVSHVPCEPPTRERVLACITAANQLLQAGRPDDAEPYAEEGAKVAQLLGLRQLEADAASVQAQLHLHRGEYDAAVRSALEACRLADATGDPLARAESLQILSLVLWHVGRLVAAVDNCRVAVEILGGERPGPYPAKWAMNLTNLAEGLIEQGEWVEALQALERVLAEPGDRTRAKDFASRLCRHLRLWRDGPDPDYVMGGLPENPDATVDTIALQDLLAGRYTDADISSHHRDLVRARAELRTLLDDDRTVQLPEALYHLLWVAARTEADARTQGWPDPDPDVGAWVVRRTARLLDLMSPQGPSQQAQDAHIRAELARWAGDDEPTTWAHVVARWRCLPCPRPLAVALTRLGSAAVVCGDRQKARESLAEALQIAERLDARPLMTAVQELARGYNLRVATAPVARNSPTDLTSRELEVLRLVAEGASNGEIGAHLFISPRTVSVHVSHILDKLGVASRTAAATLAHKRGLLPAEAPDQSRAARTYVI